MVCNIIISVAPIMYRLSAYRHNFAFIGIGFHLSDTTDIHVALTAHAHAIYYVVLSFNAFKHSSCCFPPTNEACIWYLRLC